MPLEGKIKIYTKSENMEMPSFDNDFKHSLQSSTQRFFKITTDMKEMLARNRNLIGAGVLALQCVEATAITLKQAIAEVEPNITLEHTIVTNTTLKDYVNIPAAVGCGIVFIMGCVLIAHALCGEGGCCRRARPAREEDNGQELPRSRSYAALS